MKQTVITSLHLAFALVLAAPFALAQEVPPPPEASVPREVKKDLNFDGKVDRIEKFDAKGQIAEIIADTTGDGKMDNWAYFNEGKIQKAERDSDADGKPDTYVAYDGKTGKIKMIEADSTGDGRINEWLYYEGGKPVKAEKDSNGDGKADVWIQY
jgi:hypothetical protein